MSITKPARHLHKELIRVESRGKKYRIMKAIILGLTLIGFISPALALDRAGLDERIRLLTTKFEMMQQKPDKRIPTEIWSGAIRRIKSHDNDNHIGIQRSAEFY